MDAYRTIDELRVADVSLSNVRVPREALAGREGDGLALIEEVVDSATALLCAEEVGAAKAS